MSKNILHYEFIDAVRGYAVLGVILVHAVSVAPNPAGPLHTLLVQGARGVQLFFVASAFTLMLSWDRRQDGAGQFLLRRAFRIVPMFWIATLGYIALGWISPGTWSAERVTAFDVISSLFFLPSVYPIAMPTIVPGGWTVTCEVAFYLVFPLLAISIKSARVAVAIAGGAIVCVGPIARLSESVFSLIAVGDVEQWNYLYTHFSLMNQFPVFMAGIAAYRVSVSIKEFNHAKLGLWSAVVAILLIPFVISDRWNQCAYGVTFASGVFFLSKADFRGFCTAPIRFLGTISFSAYLAHFAVLNGLVYLKSYGLDPFGLGEVGSPSRLLPLTAVVLVVTATISALTYTAIERPFIRLGNRVLTPRAPARTVPNAETS